MKPERGIQKFAVKFKPAIQKIEKSRSRIYSGLIGVNDALNCLKLGYFDLKKIIKVAGKSYSLVSKLSALPSKITT